jgi:hypothetical protein
MDARRTDGGIEAGGLIRPHRQKPAALAGFTVRSNKQHQKEPTMSMIRLSVVSHVLTDGSKVWNVRFGQTEIEACSEREAYRLADKLAAALREHTINSAEMA